MDDWDDLKGLSDEDGDGDEEYVEVMNAEASGSKRKADGDSDDDAKGGESMDEGEDDKEDKKLLPVPEGGMKPAEELNPEEIGDLKGYADPEDVAKLSSSESFKDTIKVRFLYCVI